MSGLPHGWAIAPAGELGDWRGGGTPSKSNDAFWTSGTIPWVSPKDMKRQYISDAEDHITEAAVAGSATQRVPENSILMVTRSGILQHSLPVAINTVPVTVNQDLKTLTPFEGILPEYILWHLKADAKPILEAASKTGTTVESIDFDRLKAYPIRLAPLQEQKRIVAKVDGLTARTARARADLDRIPTLIARYKQRLLALAFSGELTTSWRVLHGRPGPKEVTLSDVAKGFAYGSSAKSEKTGDVPVLRMGNIQQGKLDWSDLVFTSDSAEIKKYTLVAGDVLFNRTNSPELVGKTALYRGERPAIYAGYLIRIQCGPKLLPEFLTYCLNGPSGREYCWSVKTDGVSQSNINAKKIAAFHFLLPSLEEQAEIVRQIDSAFAWLDRVASDHGAAAKFLPKLDAAILAKAFRGELVPQEPNDEPASALLARIKGANAYSDAKTATRANRVRRLEKTKSDAPMNKTRNDSNVRGKPYLTAILRERKAPITPNELHSLSGLPLHEFYHQLAQEYDEGWLREIDGRVGVA